MHRLLQRQIDRLSLGIDMPPDLLAWRQFIERVSGSYTQADEARSLSERSMEISSREMHELYERERQANERLEERVRERTSELGRSEARFRTTFDRAPIGIMHTAVHDDRVLLANPKLSQMLGYSQEEMLTLRLDDLLHPDQARGEPARRRELMLSGELDVFSSEQCYVRKDGSRLWVNRTVSLVRDAAEGPLHFIRIVEDISERVLLTRRRALEHAVTQVLAESATVGEAMPVVLQITGEAMGWTCGGYWRWSESEELLRCASAWTIDAPEVARFSAASRRTAYEAPAWPDQPPGEGGGRGGVVKRVWLSGASVWLPEATRQPDFRHRAAAASAGIRSGFGFPILAGSRPLGVMEFYSREAERPDEALLEMVRAIGSQIGQFIQRKQAEDRVAHLAQFDTITGLPNRYLFHDRLGLTLAQAERSQRLIGLLFVDLDRFKAINDTYGHATGDLLLKEVALRLKGCVRGGDIVGRLSGDEFVILLSHVVEADHAGIVAQKIVDLLADPFDLKGQQIYVSASIGVAVFPSDGRDPDTLIGNADTAMYRAKERGRNGYQFYLPQMNQRLKQRLEYEGHLRGALERDEYRLHYQPKADLRTGALSGLEALLRWEHGGRMVSPAEFIPILEYTGFIVPVGEWVVRNVCAQIGRWQAQGIEPPPVSINLSARQFQGKHLGRLIGRIAREYGVDPRLLELELTESLLMSDALEAVHLLHDLKALGVRLSVDDFGTGYSSLAYLKRFPLDSLKIDRAFIRDSVTDPDDAAITIAITNLAHSMGLRVVAEGVETEDQLDFLRSNGCDEIQGFYFSRPLPEEECTQALLEGRRLRFPEARSSSSAPPPPAERSQGVWPASGPASGPAQGKSGGLSGRARSGVDELDALPRRAP